MGASESTSPTPQKKSWDKERRPGFQLGKWIETKTSYYAHSQGLNFFFKDKETRKPITIHLYKNLPQHSLLIPSPLGFSHVSTYSSHFTCVHALTCPCPFAHAVFIVRTPSSPGGKSPSPSNIHLIRHVKLFSVCRARLMAPFLLFPRCPGGTWLLNNLSYIEMARSSPLLFYSICVHANKKPVL